jgi:hypothetical protein
MSELNEKMTGILDWLKAGRGERHPIAEHPLKNEEHLLKNLYLKHLCSILLYDNQAGEEQKLMLDRLVAGAEAENDTEDYLRMSLEVSNESMAQLIERVEKLKYAFVLDALILCHIGKCGEKQAAFIAEIADALKTDTAGMKFIAAFAKAVLTMDAALLDEAANIRPKQISKEYFAYYARVMGAERKWLQTTENELVEIMAGVSEDCVVVHREFVSKKQIVFPKGVNIIFRDCDFKGDKSVKFKSFKTVVFEDCRFSNFNEETVFLGSAAQAKFVNCEFTNCVKRHDSISNEWLELGGVIRKGGNSKTVIYINGCRFTDCGGVNSSNYFRSSIISDCFVEECVNSVFSGCWHYSNSKNRDPEDKRRVLFSNVKHHENNKIINSAMLCPK